MAIRKIKNKRKTIVLGLDGKFMVFFGKRFPNLTSSAITKVLKTSKLEMFDDYKKAVDEYYNKVLEKNA